MGIGGNTRRAWLARATATLIPGMLIACGGETASPAPAAPTAAPKPPAAAPTAAVAATTVPAPTAAPKQKGPPVEVSFNTWYDAVVPPIQPLFKKFEEEFNVKLTVDLNASNRDTAKYTAWFACNRSWGSVGDAHQLTGPATSGAAWGQTGAGRSWGTATPVMLALQTPSR